MQKLSENDKRVMDLVNSIPQKVKDLTSNTIKNYVIPLQAQILKEEFGFTDEQLEKFNSNFKEKVDALGK